MNTHPPRKNTLTIIAAAVIYTVISSVMLPTGALAAIGRPDSFADLAEKLGPAVVNIYTTQVVKATNPLQEFFFNQDKDIPAPFKRFFGIPDGHPEVPQQKEMKRTSLGSGVIINEDGYIITNNHVVDNATEINIRLITHKEYEAKIIGRDPKTDLALLKIEPTEKLPTVTLGDSEKLRVGDWVLAIGNPFGFEQTVTAGIVSGKGRNLGGAPYENFIQTDASINPGNSGGPLFDTNGKMVGINTAIYSRSGGNIGIGFAIPVNMAKNVLDQLKKHGKVVRGWLGVMIQQVTQELANQFGLDRPMGALVSDISPDSPAAKAGIQPGDIISKYMGKEIQQMSMLPSLVAQTPVGEKATLEVIRKGKAKTVIVTIGQLEEEELAQAPGEPKIEQNFGLTVQELTPELAESLGTEETSGLLVTDVEQGSAAAEAGIRRGDLIQEVNRKPVNDLTEFKAALKKTEQDRNILFLIRRNKHSSFLVLKKNNK